MSKTREIVLFIFVFSLVSASNEEGFDTIFYPETEKIGPINKLEGKIKIHGFLFKTDCVCTKNDPKEQLKEKCNPAEIKIEVDKKGEINIEKSKINSFIGKISELQWVDISKSSFTCIDGRVKEKSLSTPGGDAGEFILALHVYENYFKNKKTLSKDQISAAFKKYLKFFKAKKFYLCTDEKSQNRLKEQIKVILKERGL